MANESADNVPDTAMPVEPQRPETQSPVAAPQLQPIEIIHAMFCGPIDQLSSSRIANFLSVAMTGKVKKIHLMFQSTGGYVGDGVFLYSMFRAVPIELTLYNAGQLSSAAVIAYLGAKHRKTSRHGVFMMHKSFNTSAMAAGSAKLQSLAKGLILDDARTEAIAREHMRLPEELWEEMEHHNVYISGEDAVTYGIADEIAEFSPPPNTQVYNIQSTT